MNPLHVIQIPILEDNYTYLIRDEDASATAVVDPAAAAPVLERLATHGWSLDWILSTHRHGDHVGGNLELKRETGCRVVGPRAEAGAIPGLDVALGDGERFALGGIEALVFDTPGHTAGHITYWFERAHAVFCGDVLFGLGCGRLFEGTPATMWSSLEKLRALPPDTLVYCGHEYTESNARFAVTVEPDNSALARRIDDVARLRAKDLPTVPFTLEQELDANPFLRPESEEIRARLDLADASDVDVFARLRSMKDGFRG